MKEKVLKNKKNGIAMLLLFLLLYIAAIAGTVVGGIIISRKGLPILLIISCIWLAVGWIPFCGLKVLKPQEALVLTLFGKYVGTLKEEGFYYVNPFCASVNPAAKTKLSQSGDVDRGARKAFSISMEGTNVQGETPASNKISLKVMTLNNSRQKINDCLGNPVEIGIAVMWKVTDTAKAVFNVDN